MSASELGGTPQELDALRSVDGDETPQKLVFVDAKKDRKWIDMSSELWREYVYRDRTSYRVSSPLKLHIDKTKPGGHRHRLFDKFGMSHYISPGWVAIRWEATPGTPNFLDV